MGVNTSKSKNKARAQETSEDLKRLEESFERVFSGRNPFQREYILVEEAKKWDMPLDEYRKLFESYCKYTSNQGWLRKLRLSTIPTVWRWTGIAEKKLWDYVQLVVGISIPITIFVAGQYFTSQTNEKQQKIADEHYHQDLLSKYFDQMTDLITTKQLLNPDKGKESQIIARARTLSTLRELGEDGETKGLLINFLYEANLISDKAFVKLVSADLNGAKLNGADLHGANLHGANLHGADLNRVGLNEANLNEAYVHGADLNGANLNGANLNGANLNGANLNGANLSGANLEWAYLEWAHLNKANLNKANLNEANLNEANLERADLNGACLNQVYKVTPEQVKTAQNWQGAYYSPNFRKQLGLPADTRNSPPGCF